MRHLAILSGFVILFFGSPRPTFAQPAEPGVKRPNVVFIFTDDQRADTIAALGNRHIQTPNLDKLVAEGTYFHRAYCMGALQGAVCVPSRAMMLTGKTLFRVDTSIKRQVTWPEILARAGYVTFMTGKWHNGFDSAPRCFAWGKSIFFGGMGDPYTLPVADFSGKELAEPHDSVKHSVELFTDEAIAFFRKQTKEQRPFVAYIAFNSPHDPRLAPKKHHDIYNAAKPPLPPNYLPVHPFDNGDMVQRDELLAPWPRTPEVVRQHLADYYACITFIDEQVGRIVAALKEAGMYENTIIIFSSDHGLAIGSHGLFGKQNLYDHSMRVPFVIAGPGLPKGKTSDALIYLFDIFPTVCDLTDAVTPAGVEGKSVVPFLRAEATKSRDAIFLAYRDDQRALIEGRWHLIRYPQINRTQLFDLEADPHETKDLANDEKYQERISELMTSLRRRQIEMADKLPLTSRNPRSAIFTPPANDPK